MNQFKNLPIGYSLFDNFKSSSINIINQIILDADKASEDIFNLNKDNVNKSDCLCFYIHLLIFSIISGLINNTKALKLYFLGEIHDYVKHLVSNISDIDTLHINHILDECNIDKKLYKEFLDDIYFQRKPRKSSKFNKVLFANRLFCYYYNNKLFEAETANISTISTIFIAMLLMFYYEVNWQDYNLFQKKTFKETIMWSNIIKQNNNLIYTNTLRSNNIERLNNFVNEILNHPKMLFISQNELFYVYLNTLIPLIMYFIITKIYRLEIPLAKDELASLVNQILKH